MKEFTMGDYKKILDELHKDQAWQEEAVTAAACSRAYRLGYERSRKEYEKAEREKKQKRRVGF